jgi:hypothetical protein
MRTVDAAALEQAAQVGGGLRLAFEATRGVDARVERFGRALEAVDAQRRGDVRCARQLFGAAQREAEQRG